DVAGGRAGARRDQRGRHSVTRGGACLDDAAGTPRSAHRCRNREPHGVPPPRTTIGTRRKPAFPLFSAAAGSPVSLISSATRHRRDLQAVPYPPGEPSTMTDTRKDTLRDETHRVFDDADGEDQRRARDEAYVTGLYASPAEADRAYNHLRTSHGYG